MTDRVDVQRDGDVFILRMQVGENRFNPDLLADVEGALDEVEGSTGPAALVVTGDGKYFSNGLDLEWMLAAGGDAPVALVARVQQLYARVLTIPMFTIGALNGHTFAAGAMLALALDERVMRIDRGFFCLPEVDIGLPFTAGMSALITARLAPQTAHVAMIGGERYGGEEALRRGIVDQALPENQVLPRAVERAQALAVKRGATLGAIKSRLAEVAVAHLLQTQDIRLPGIG